MKYMTGNEIRNTWLKFFKDKGHLVERGASLIPNDDPTLLWMNSGVAALKKYFDGRIVPKNPRIVNVQKCIRTNDIENVGNTSRHHTFFEMLGNFSIGDYFRDEALDYAFEILTSEEYFGFDINKLYFTIYPKDLQSYDKWLSLGVPEERIIPTDDLNFWEIGEGPCGPCTEVFFDRGPKYGDFGVDTIKKDIENDRYVEVWNIVLSQYNSKPGLKRSEYPELPSQNIDTGMGLERMSCVIQDVPTNFETDLFIPTIKVIEKLSGVKYTGQMSFKVIADHVRSVVFAVSDGAVLSNEGRGYVLRRLLRRAIKHGKQLGIKKPFLTDLVDVVVETMGDFYKYLHDSKDLVKKLISIEETKFLETLSQGEKRLDDMMNNTKGKTISGVNAFTLYDTYGFPIELTEEIAEDAGYVVDKDGFISEMEKQKERARSARKNIVSMNNQNEELINFKDQDEFVGYANLSIQTTVLKSFDEGVVLTETPFYAESGGQVADSGVIKKGLKEFTVLDVQKTPNGQFMHFIENNTLKTGDSVEAIVDESVRTKIVYNHSATHILFAALREIVGTHVSQQGSQVTSESLRFDFNNFQNLDDETLLKVEAKVNEKIKEAIKVGIGEFTVEEAKAQGAIAEFGEKYGAFVRVINMDYTVDLCGGTHVSNTGDIGKFALASIESKGSGIYRIVGHASTAIENIRNQFVGFHKEMDKLLVKVDKMLKEALDNEIVSNRTHIIDII